MSISETQLERWSHQGAVTTAKATADSIKRALDSLQSWQEGVTYEVYLQGSYKNSTNIRGDSDVDVVAQITSTFYSNLTIEQRKILELAPAYYQWQDFRRDVQKALQSYFGSQSVLNGDKSLKVKGNNGRLPADVVVCATYRKYSRLESLAFIEGMCFWTQKENKQIINYPKIHYNNGSTKMSLTNEKFKSLVRIFKNARSVLAENNVISKELAPSYFIECLLYNSPNPSFVSTYQETIVRILRWLENSDWSRFVSQNEQEYLFGANPTQWSESNARAFISIFRKLWGD